MCMSFSEYEKSAFSKNQRKTKNIFLELFWVQIPNNKYFQRCCKAAGQFEKT